MIDLVFFVLNLIIFFDKLKQFNVEECSSAGCTNGNTGLVIDANWRETLGFNKLKARGALSYRSDPGRDVPLL